MTQDSEIDRHLRAMLLIIDGMKCEHRLDWDALRHMVWHAQTIARGIEDQRRDDADELDFQLRERDRLQAEVEKMRKRLTELEAAIEEQGQEAMQQMSQEAMRQMGIIGSGFGEVTQCPDA
jgi:regulator of replication initiation timing